MRTISTKLDPKLHNQFVDICNKEGKCQSEMLRDMIETLCDDCNEGEETLPDLEIEVEEPTPETIEPAIMAHGKILDDYGNVIGTF